MIAPDDASHGAASRGVITTPDAAPSGTPRGRPAGYRRSGRRAGPRPRRLAAGAGTSSARPCRRRRAAARRRRAARTARCGRAGSRRRRRAAGRARSRVPPTSTAPVAPRLPEHERPGGAERGDGGVGPAVADLAHLPAGEEQAAVEEEHRRGPDPARLGHGAAPGREPAQHEPRDHGHAQCREHERRDADAGVWSHCCSHRGPGRTPIGRGRPAGRPPRMPRSPSPTRSVALGSASGHGTSTKAHS